METAAPTPTKKKRSNRDVAVELARIIGALMVIAVHTKVPMDVDGIQDYSRTFLSCFIGDGVAIFFLITGFFMFGNKSFSKMLKSLVWKVLVPIGAITFATLLLRGWLTGSETLAQSLTLTGDDLSALKKGLLSWDNAVPGAGHLWFLYVYALLILAFPALSASVKLLDGSPRQRRYFCIVTAVLLVVNDVTRNATAGFSLHPANAFFPAAILVIWGHLIYRHRQRFSGHPLWGLGALVLFVGVNLVRARFQIQDSWDGLGNHLVCWYTSWGLLCSALIVIACFSLAPKDTESVPGRLIVRVGGATMLIYLLHQLIASTLRGHGFMDGLMASLGADGSSALTDALYVVVIVGVVFLLSLVFALLLQALGALVRRLWTTARKGQREASSTR